MALTRKMLEGMGIENDKIEAIIEAHSESVNAIKAERDRYKATAESIDTTEDWKAKYEKEHADFESYKETQQKKETRAAKENALREVYKEAGIADKFMAKAIKLTDFDNIEFDKNNNVKNRNELVESAKSEFDAYISKEQRQSGVETAMPPAGNGKATMTKEQIFAIKDPDERLNAIADNITLFDNY